MLHHSFRKESVLGRFSSNEQIPLIVGNLGFFSLRTPDEAFDCLWSNPSRGYYVKRVKSTSSERAIDTVIPSLEVLSTSSCIESVFPWEGSLAFASCPLHSRVRSANSWEIKLFLCGLYGISNLKIVGVRRTLKLHLTVIMTCRRCSLRTAWHPGDAPPVPHQLSISE